MQVVEDGYEFFADRQLVTIFSAPNYCGEFDNAGVLMSVDETLLCSFQVLKPEDKNPKLMLGSLSTMRGNPFTKTKVFFFSQIFVVDLAYKSFLYFGYLEPHPFLNFSVFCLA